MSTAVCVSIILIFYANITFSLHFGLGGWLQIVCKGRYMMANYMLCHSWAPSFRRKGWRREGWRKDWFFEGREGNKEKEGLVQKILLRRKNEGRCWFWNFEKEGLEKKMVCKLTGLTLSHGLKSTHPESAGNFPGTHNAPCGRRGEISPNVADRVPMWRGAPSWEREPNASVVQRNASHVHMAFPEKIPLTHELDDQPGVK